MSMEKFTSGDSEEPSDDPSGTHIYFYEKGHDRLPDDEEAAGVIAEAFEVFNRNGSLRNAVNNSDQWKNASEFLAEYVLAMNGALQAGNTSPLLQLIEPNAESIGEYLNQNEDVRNELISRLKDSESSE